MSILVPKIRVQTVSNDTGACFKYRLQEPVKAVEASDREFIFSHVPQLNTDMASRYDIVIFQRPLSRVVADSISYLQSKGVKVIVDIDDDFEAVHRKNAAFANIQPRNNPDSNWEWLILACKRADLVTTSTEYLASKYKSNTGGAIVLPNFLPNDILSVNGAQHRGRVRIGWTGRVMTHPNDLPMVGSSVKKAVKKLGADFVIVGDGLGVPEQAKLEKHEVHVTGNVPIDSYYKTVADNIDIGIAPLEPSEFNQAKCLDKGTKVLTQTGVRNIIDVQVGDKVYDRHGSLREVVGRSAESARVGLKITTEDGYTVSLSREHRLLVNNRWVRGSDITVGDILHLSTVSHAAHEYVKVNWPSDSRMTRGAEMSGQEFTAKEDAPQITITPRWGRVLGAFCGDGSFSGKTAICFSCDGIDRDWIELLANDIDQIGVRATNVEKKMFNGTTLRKRDIRIASAHLIRFLQSLGLSYYKENGHPKRLVKVPDVIWNSPLDVVAEFLSGYFEADGTTHSSGVSATSKDIDFLQDIQKLLLMFGIQSKLTQKKSHSQNGYEGVYGLLTLGKYASIIFQERIGFKSQRKRDKLSTICSRKPSNAVKDMRFKQKIVSIEEVEITPVDIQVEGEEFIANGFVSHNSYLKMLEYSGLGIPSIGSPTAENILLNEDGIGILAHTQAEWSRAFSLLISNERKREQLGQEARRVVKDKYTLNKNAYMWADTWKSLVGRGLTV